MADKKRISMAPPKPKPKGPSTTTCATTLKVRPPHIAKDEVTKARRNLMNSTIIDDGDVTISELVPSPASIPAEFQEDYRQISYNKFLRTMLEDCLVEEKIEREESEVDVQMSLLAQRFEKTINQLDNTSKRLKEINFAVEHQRLLDLKKSDTADFYKTTDSSNVEDILRDLKLKEQVSLDRLETKNIDFGYDKNTGHKQLLDAVDDAIQGLEEIKKHSQLDINKFKQYGESMDNLQDIEKDRFDMEKLRKEFEEKFPKFGEKLLKQCSDSISKMMDDDSTELSRQLDLWLSKANLSHGPARAIIAPHAGYSYCGACGAFAYRQVSPVVVKRIFILGPSHHVRLGGCALSSLDKYQTPLYDLTIDKQIYAELEATRQFTWMDVQTDEDEHSIEMHLPYIAKVMEEYKTGFTIIPILVGSLTPDKEAKYGSILAPYLADPQNLFVISTDFCHWGQRFRYTWKDAQRGQIHQSIEWLDKQGMDIIEKLDPKAFTEYLNKYGNTICGRHPVGVLLQAVSKLGSQANAPRMSMKFLKYAQSSQCTNMQDSSVSYASASLVFE